MNNPTRTRAPLSRRGFLGATTLLLAAARARAADAAASVPPIGLCSSADKAERLRGLGLDYLEENFRSLTAPESDDEKAAARLAAAAKAAIPVRSCNGFLPGELKATGPKTDHDAIVKYAATGFRRAQQAGVQLVVFGSGGSRQLPDGFAREEGERQMIELGRRLAPEAERCGIVLAIEPLNRGECNFLNRVGEIARIVKEVAHPALQLTADLYHMAREDDGPEELAAVVSTVRHVHIAEKAKRSAPGVAGDDFRPCFAVLKRAGYAGRISFECGWGDQAAELPRAIATVRQQWAEA